MMSRRRPPTFMPDDALVPALDDRPGAQRERERLGAAAPGAVELLAVSRSDADVLHVDRVAVLGRLAGADDQVLGDKLVRSRAPVCFGMTGFLVDVALARARRDLDGRDRRRRGLRRSSAGSSPPPGERGGLVGLLGSLLPQPVTPTEAMAATSRSRRSAGRVCVDIRSGLIARRGARRRHTPSVDDASTARRALTFPAREIEKSVTT